MRPKKKNNNARTSWCALRGRGEELSCVQGVGLRQDLWIFSVALPGCVFLCGSPTKLLRGGGVSAGRVGSIAQTWALKVQLVANISVRVHLRRFIGPYGVTRRGEIDQCIPWLPRLWASDIHGVPKSFQLRKSRTRRRFERSRNSLSPPTRLQICALAPGLFSWLSVQRARKVLIVQRQSVVPKAEMGRPSSGRLGRHQARFGGSRPTTGQQRAVFGRSQLALGRRRPSRAEPAPSGRTHPNIVRTRRQQGGA